VNRTETDPTRSQRLLAEYLADRDLACPNCAYNLRGLTTDRCPECGEPLRLELRGTERRMGAYLVLLSGCCVGLGGGLLFTIALLSYNGPGDWLRQPGPAALAGLALVCGCALPFVVRSRGRFQRCAARTRWFLCGSMWALVVALSTAAILFLL
jgi:hypothetical protein